MASERFLRPCYSGSRIEYGAPSFYSSKEQLVESLRALLRIADCPKGPKDETNSLKPINLETVVSVCLTNSHSRKRESFTAFRTDTNHFRLLFRGDEGAGAWFSGANLQKCSSDRHETKGIASRNRETLQGDV